VIAENSGSGVVAGSGGTNAALWHLPFPDGAILQTGLSRHESNRIRCGVNRSAIRAGDDRRAPTQRVVVSLVAEAAKREQVGLFRRYEPDAPLARGSSICRFDSFVTCRSAPYE